MQIFCSNTAEPGLVAEAYNPQYSSSWGRRVTNSRPPWAAQWVQRQFGKLSETLPPKGYRKEVYTGMEHVFGTNEVLVSISSTIDKQTSKQPGKPQQNITEPGSMVASSAESAGTQLQAVSTHNSIGFFQLGTLTLLCLCFIYLAKTGSPKNSATVLTRTRSIYTSQLCTALQIALYCACICII